MAWWQFAIGAVWAVLMWVRIRRGRRGDTNNLLAGSERDMIGRGGF